MANKFIVTIVVFIGVSLAVFFYFQKSAIEQKKEQVLVETNEIAPKEEQINYHPEVSIQALSATSFDGRDLELGPVQDDNSAYTRYYITYKSGELVISGIMNVPKGDGPFPVLILNHGYIDPAIYTNGRGLKREQDYFARRGYVVIHPDYRNHADSTKVGNVEEGFRLGYAEDVANAVYAVRESELGFFDKENIGMMGHSMGGGVALQLMTAHPKLVGAVSLYAPVSADVRDNFEKWTRSRTETAQKIIDTHGHYDDNPEFWDNMSPINFLDKVQAPVILHHGTADASVPIDWSDRLETAMLEKGKNITYHIYNGGAHEFGPEWNIFMQRNTEFFDKYLK